MLLSWTIYSCLWHSISHQIQAPPYLWKSILDCLNFRGGNANIFQAISVRSARLSGSYYICVCMGDFNSSEMGYKVRGKTHVTKENSFLKSKQRPIRAMFFILFIFHYIMIYGRTQKSVEEVRNLRNIPLRSPAFNVIRHSMRSLKLYLGYTSW